MLNRARSNGRYGIWGHSIGDLIYHGGYVIAYENETVYAEIGCDS